jgi:alanine racemase
MQHKTWVEISASALKKNSHALHSILNDGVTFCAVVKANAYGHDLDTIVRFLLLEHIDHFAVDSIDEAELVRKRAPNAEIFILGYTPPERIKDVISNQCIQTVYDLDTLSMIAKDALELQEKAKINIKIETGTRRQGIELSALEPFLRTIKQLERDLILVGISSHFADAENANDRSFTESQNTLFEQARDKATALGFAPKYIHISCSASGILTPETQHSMVRFGIAMYGLWSSDSLKSVNRVSNRAIDLSPVLSWKTRIAQIKDIPPRVPIGYSHGFISDRPMRIAILPIGYYDGFTRSNKGKGKVLIRGQQCQLIGNICMNMCMADVSTMPQLKVGEIATILGKDGMHQISTEDIAQRTNTINYEVVTSINPLLPRIVV